MAGLAAAVDLAKRGIAVSLSDSAAQAGGRCRSYFDPQIGARIDNGNHLVLSGNPAVARYLAAIGASDRLAGPDNADFNWVNVTSGERWRISPSAGRVPWWVLNAGKRVPGTGVGDYLPLARFLKAAPGKTLGELLPERGPLWRNLLEPFFVSALNTRPDEASADLAGAIVRETLVAGGDAYRPRIAHPSLAAAFVDPALALLDAEGAHVTLKHRLRGLRFDGDSVTGLDFGDGEVPLGPQDKVILAVPPWVAAELVPDLTVPDRFHAIVNGHFACVPPPGTPMILGVLGGTVEWIFAFEDRISVTISCADDLAAEAREPLAAKLWADVAKALDVPPELPRWQIVKEQRATFSATPEQDARRPQAQSRWQNLVLAGDWTATGLPATIEGALRSGFLAASLVH
jgi:squalene-associated FAD-dependent desaturase